jgi:hypothetical protein
MAAPLRLRVGVTGHRVPPKLPAESTAPLRDQIDGLFAAFVAAMGETERDFVVVSSLAEGSDRIVSEAGLAAGFRLEVVLPLNRSEYARDFETEASRQEFEQLLTRASDIFEVGGAPDERPRAYEAAGLFMLANVDVLIAIWDGKPAAGIGGTEEIFNRAFADGLFVVWIEPIHPHTIKISPSKASDARSKDEFHPAEVATVAQAVKRIISRQTRQADARGTRNQ